MNLTDLLARSVVAERVHVRIREGVRRLAWFSITATCVQLALHKAFESWMRGEKPSLFLVGWPMAQTLERWSALDIVVGAHVALVATMAIVAIWTDGFATGPIVLHYVILVCSAIGIATPLPVVLVVVLAAFNAAIWVVLGILIVAAMILVVAALLMGAES